VHVYDSVQHKISFAFPLKETGNGLQYIDFTPVSIVESRSIYESYANSINPGGVATDLRCAYFMVSLPLLARTENPGLTRVQTTAYSHIFAGDMPNKL
jgi:hypothetical protein